MFRISARCCAVVCCSGSMLLHTGLPLMRPVACRLGLACRPCTRSETPQVTTHLDAEYQFSPLNCWGSLKNHVDITVRLVFLQLCVNDRAMVIRIVLTHPSGLYLDSVHCTCLKFFKSVSQCTGSRELSVRVARVVRFTTLRGSRLTWEAMDGWEGLPSSGLPFMLFS